MTYTKDELIEYIGECITNDTEYKASIAKEFQNYTEDKLINAACEYTELLKKDITIKKDNT